MMAVFDDSSKIISVQTQRELREYFDSTGLLLAGAGLEHWPKEEEEVELSQVSDAEMDRGAKDAAEQGRGKQHQNQQQQQVKEKEEEQEMTELKL